MKKGRFGYEELQVWQKAVEFALLVIDLLDQPKELASRRIIPRSEGSRTGTSLMLKGVINSLRP